MIEKPIKNELYGKFDEVLEIILKPVKKTEPEVAEKVGEKPKDGQFQLWEESH